MSETKMTKLNVTSTVFGEDPSPAWLEVEEVEPGLYKVVDNSMTVDNGQSADRYCLGYSLWDGEVEDLDDGDSDVSNCLNLSTRLRCGEVELTSEWDNEAHLFRAPSLAVLRDALSHVTFEAYCPDDI